MTRTNPFESGRNDRERGVSRRSVLERAASGLAVTVGLVGLSTPVTASHEDDEPIGDFLAESDSWSKLSGSASGAYERLFADESESSAATLADDTTTVFNQNASTLFAYANDRLSTSRSKADLDVIRVEWHKDDETAKRWIVATVDSENTFVDATMTDTRPDREQDHFVELEALAADQSANELEHFIDEYANPGEPIDPTYEGRLAGKYGADVDTSLID